MEKIKIEVEPYEFLLLLVTIDNVLIDDYRAKQDRGVMQEMDAYILISLCAIRNKMKLAFRKIDPKTYNNFHCRDKKVIEADKIEKKIDHFPLEVRTAAYSYFVDLNKNFPKK